MVPEQKLFTTLTSFELEVVVCPSVQLGTWIVPGRSTELASMVGTSVILDRLSKSQSFDC